MGVEVVDGVGSSADRERENAGGEEDAGKMVDEFFLRRGRWEKGREHVDERSLEGGEVMEDVGWEGC